MFEVLVLKCLATLLLLKASAEEVEVSLRNKQELRTKEELH